jgi:hypothetical protein
MMTNRFIDQSGSMVEMTAYVAPILRSGKALTPDEREDAKVHAASELKKNGQCISSATRSQARPRRELLAGRAREAVLAYGSQPQNV